MNYSDYLEYKNAFDDIIKSGLYRRHTNEIENIAMTLDEITFAKEFKTIHINFGRCTGKSRYILEKATSADLIICFSEEVRKNLFSQARSHIITVAEELKYNVSKLKQSNKPKNIYVDEPELCGRELFPLNIDEWLYDTFNDNKNIFQTFILLGR